MLESSFSLISCFTYNSMLNSFFNLIFYPTDKAVNAQHFLQSHLLLYMQLNAQLFLQLHLLPYRQGSLCSTLSSVSSLTLQTRQSMLNSFFSLIFYLTDNAVNAQLFLQPQRLGGTEHGDRVVTHAHHGILR
jgi:hypothetical protein